MTDAFCFNDRVIVVAVNFDNIGAEARNRRDPLRTDAFMNEDIGLASGEIGSGGNGPAVIAVCRTADIDVAHNSAHVGVEQFAGKHGAAEHAARLFKRETNHGVSTAQRLETAKPEPPALVLDMNRSHARRGRHLAQRAQRRRPITRVQPQHCQRFFGGHRSKHLLIQGQEGLAAVDALVAFNHICTSFGCKISLLDVLFYP